ncbi:MAG: cysteine synthase A [Clostridiales bacterium]|nr:cysteine synthase A [Clostridiales bacterium]
MKIYDSFESLIGNTPLIKLSNFMKKNDLKATILAKLEYFNPAGSAKDRIALFMIQDAERSGRLKKGGTIIEPTSGNTGIGLAALSAAKGYKMIVTMPETMSVERRLLMKAYGAKLVLTDGKKGMSGAIEKAKELNETIPGSIIAGQFENPANPEAHYRTTGPEIWKDTDGEIDIFAAGVGTGGTITGVGKFLKEKNPKIHIAAIEPASSPVLSKGIGGSHKIQGIGAGFVPTVLDVKIIDEIIPVSDSDAYNYAREAAKTEGIFIGISSGAALAAATYLATKKENEGKNIAVLLPDSGERYLSAESFIE